MSTVERTSRTRCWVAPAPVKNHMPNPNAQYDLTYASTVNAALFRQVSGSVNAPYYTLFRLNASANPASWLHFGDTGDVHLDLEPSKTYTVRGRFHLDAPLTGSVDANARRIVAYTRVGSGSYTSTASSAAPNTAGTHFVSVTFTTPASMSEAFVRFFLGHTGGSGYWFGLTLTEGTETDIWDGETPNGGGIDDVEYGWEGPPGKSTSTKVDLSDKVEIPEAELTISYDVNRAPFINATLTAPRPAESVIDMLDPRRPDDVIIIYAVDHYARTGVNGPFTARVGGIPLGYAEDTAGKLWLDSDDTDELGDTIVLSLNSGEVELDDKHRISAAVIDTGATDVGALVEYALSDVGQYSALGSLGAAGLTPVPAGDRRLWLSGESAASLYESELGAIDLRLFCDDRGRYYVAGFDEPPVQISGWGDADLYDDDDGTISSLRRRRSRRAGGWGDAVLVKGEYIDGAGAQVVEYDRFPVSGQNHRGFVVNIDRAIPDGYAETIVNRARKRGEEYTVTAMLDTEVRVGRLTHIHRTGRPDVDIVPDSITYRVSDGEMDIVGHVV